MPVDHVWTSFGSAVPPCPEWIQDDSGSPHRSASSEKAPRRVPVGAKQAGSTGFQHPKWSQEWPTFFLGVQGQTLGCDMLGYFRLCEHCWSAVWLPVTNRDLEWLWKVNDTSTSSIKRRHRFVWKLGLVCSNIFDQVALFFDQLLKVC